MNLERDGGWDKDLGGTLKGFSFFVIHSISLSMCIGLCVDMYACACILRLYLCIKHVAYSYFDYIVSHIHTEKEKKSYAIINLHFESKICKMLIKPRYKYIPLVEFSLRLPCIYYQYRHDHTFHTL